MRTFTILSRALTLLLGCQIASASDDPSSRGQKRPNIIFIITDDQDSLLRSLDYQPAVKQQFREQGTYFEKHYCNIAVCCPSRVSLLTGKHAHNTNVTDVRLPFGGYPKFVSEGLNGNWLPSWFQQNRYNTYYTGKLMNNHSIINYNSPFPAGFNATDFLIDPNTYIYYNASMQSNRDPPRYVQGQYSTDTVAQRAVNFIDDAAQAPDPFFLTVAPIGPHGETIIPPTIPGQPRAAARFEPPVAADKYKNLYSGVKVPRTPNFNPDVANGPSYFKTLPKWNQTVIDYYDEFYRKRLRTLASIDDLINLVVAKTDALGITDNTYIIYTSDNGFHIGQHRLPAGKSCAIEEDINIPFFIRGPGIAKNRTIRYPTSHVDIAPTLFEIAGIPPRSEFDGAAMPIWAHQHGDPKGNHQTRDVSSTARSHSFAKAEHVNVEFWGANFGEGGYADGILNPTNNTNTYKALRLISTDGVFNLAYVVWCTNEHELYDMNVDSQQMNNIAVSFNATTLSTSPAVGPRAPTVEQENPFSSRLAPRKSGSDKPQFQDPGYILRLQSRLDTLLMVLKTCKAETCRDPWGRIHPDGKVKSLRDAMRAKYDDFYVRQQPKVRSVKCAAGYLRDLEGPGDDRGDVKIWDQKA
ncbi:ABC transporter G family member [Sphaceloma murrayae]|uniref:Arylsulfatase n=1 Tax=Sphaceloma murrayae TaxID=2082308 RepID=A0A2K1QLH6_9PEZI|nr:ABC transporter G family member [Sphaceloma murrayae]